MTPITEADVIMCPHGGKVTLKAQDPSFKHKGIPCLAITDLDQATISGCQNKLPNGTPKPCTMTITGSPTAASKCQRNNIPLCLIEKVSQVMTDNGMPVQLAGSPVAAGDWNIL